MGFDIIVVKPTDTSVDDISDVVDVVSLGTIEVVTAAFHSTFPNCLSGAFICSEAYSVEGSLGGDPVQSAHLQLRFGQLSSDDTTTEFLAVLADVCRKLDAIAFAVSDNSRLCP